MRAFSFSFSFVFSFAFPFCIEDSTNVPRGLDEHPRKHEEPGPVTPEDG